MFHQVQTWRAIRAMCTDSSLKEGHVCNHVSNYLAVFALPLFYCRAGELFGSCLGQTLAGWKIQTCLFLNILCVLSSSTTKCNGTWCTFSLFLGSHRPQLLSTTRSSLLWDWTAFLSSLWNHWMVSLPTLAAFSSSFLFSFSKKCCVFV